MKKNALIWLFLALMSLTATAKAPNSPSSQREDNTTFLQLSVSCKIKHEIIKKLVSRLWHRSLLYQP